MRSRKIAAAWPQSEVGIGVVAMLGACVLNALNGVGFYQAHALDPHYSPSAGIFVRILANFSCLLIPLLRREPLPRLKPWRGHRSLWLWSLLGVLGASTYFLAVPLVGCGITMFLNAGSGIFIAALAPYLLAQRTCRTHWLGAIGSFAGLALLAPASGAGPGAALGALLAMLSGFFGGLAFLMVARSKKTCSADSVLFHWGVANLLAYGGFLFFFPPTWPANGAVWLTLAVAGLLGAGSQYLAAVAYQKAPASLAACLYYLGPVLALGLDSLCFGLNFGARELAGAGVVLFFGVAIPLYGLRRSQRQAIAHEVLTGSAEPVFARARARSL